MLQYTRHCARLAACDVEGEANEELGVAGGLTVALISSGRAGFLAQNEAVLAPAGSFVLAAGPLQLAPVGPCHVVAVALGGAAPQDMAAGLNGPRLVESSACPGAAEELFRLLSPALLPAGESALAYSLLCRISAAEAQDAPLPPLVAAAIALIREHYGEVYGVEELAKELDVSKSHLVRSFSAALGMPPGKYLAMVRLEAAKRLLLQRTYSLETVAALSGFSGANYLCKVFKKATGESPAAWRSRHAGSMPLPSAAEDERESRMYL